MDVSKIFTKIKELGHVCSRREELREYCKLKLDQITKLIPRRILNSDAGDLLDCILIGLPDNPTKVKLIEQVLQVMRKESTSLTHCTDVITRVCLELPRLPAGDLVRWTNDSIQSIVDDSDVNMIWRDVLPECLNALATHDTISHCGTDMSSSEFKEQCVHTLCHCRWKENQLVQLAAMFKDMQLSRNDHKQVVNKICSYVIDFPPDTLPPLVHQLVRLCKRYDVDIVLSHLSHYFNLRLYSKLEPPPQNSESTTMDIDDIVQYSPAELSRCLSTCIYHITQGAAEPELIRKHVKAWPKTQLLRNPFLLDLALAMSAKGADFRSVCLDVVKSAIEQRELDEMKRKESAWARSVIPPDVDVVSVLKVLTTESANHRDLTVIGLINLAFSLLSTARVRPTAQACWSHGKLVLVRLCKAQPETAPHILSQLSDRLATDCMHKQYAECLYVLCSLSPVAVERCTQLSGILENCQPTPAEPGVAAAVLDAVHPLLNFSMRTRDALVMVCRKGLYSRDSSYRCLALSGFLTVLRHVKLSRSLASSQGTSIEQYSAHSYLTQLSLDMHATQLGNQVTSRVRNEAMCLEVVSILRRCLVQDAAVKQMLYTKIHSCAKEKPVLHEPILELIYEHLTKYLPESDENLTPLLFDKCVQHTATSALLVEPISRLLYVIAQFLQPAVEEDLEDILASPNADTSSAYLKSKLTNVMDEFCASESFGRIDMEEYGLADLTPESKAKYLKVQQILQSYEALIAYQIMQWNLQSESAASSVYNLYKACNQLLEQTKIPSKSSKKGTKTTPNETRETIKSQKSQKTQKEKGKGPVKVSNLVKDRAGPFKPLPCVWDLKLCLQVMELLYNEDVPWSSTEQRNQLRSRREFHHWALRCVQSAINDRVDKRSTQCIASIAGVLYKRCICRWSRLICLRLCIQRNTHCVSKLHLGTPCSEHLNLDWWQHLPRFWPAHTSGHDASAGESVAAILEQLHSALTHNEEEAVAERDVMVKRLGAALVHTTALLLETRVKPCEETIAVLIKLENYVRTSKQDSLSLIPPLLAAACREQREAQLLDDLLLKLTVALGRIDDEDTSAGDDESPHFPLIDSRSGHAALGHVCAHLVARCKCAEHLLHRARDLHAALLAATQHNRHRIDTELKQLYTSLVIQLCQLTAWTVRAAKLRCCVGSGSDRVLTACVRLYAVLAALARQLDPPTALLVRFERLLKLSGKKLSAVTDSLITYLEASQQEQNSNKVLRDTKLIPRLVFEAEQFSKHVILLADKAKVNYQEYLSLGTARDFRIKGPVLQEVLEVRQRELAGEDDEQEKIHDAETDILSPVQSDQEEAEDRNKPSGSKRRRMS